MLAYPRRTVGFWEWKRLLVVVEFSSARNAPGSAKVMGMSINLFLGRRAVPIFRGLRRSFANDIIFHLWVCLFLVKPPKMGCCPLGFPLNPTKKGYRLQTRDTHFVGGVLKPWTRTARCVQKAPRPHTPAKSQLLVSAQDAQTACANLHPRRKTFRQSDKHLSRIDKAR